MATYKVNTEKSEYNTALWNWSNLVIQTVGIDKNMDYFSAKIAGSAIGTVGLTLGHDRSIQFWGEPGYGVQPKVEKSRKDKHMDAF